MVQVTYACNLFCRHCAYGDLHDTREVSLDAVCAFLERHNPKLIKLSGGEPTIARNYYYVLRLCKETGAKVITFTNGLQRPEEHPDYYWVSLYGDEKFHNWVTKAPTFHKVIEFIKEHNVEYINSPIFSLEQMESLVSISEKLKVPLRITRLLPHGSARNLNVLSLEEQMQVVRWLGLNEPPNWVTCSLGFEPPRCWKKACLKPDGREVICTHLIRGLRCPFHARVSRGKGL